METGTDLLPPVAERDVGGDLVQTSDARALHAFLKVGRDFSNWIKGRIAQYGFVEGVDYVTTEDLSSPNPASAKSRPQLRTNYHLTLGMAKEVAMVENNDQGRRVRRYYIACERRTREARPPVPQTLAQALRLAADQAEELERQRLAIADLSPKAAVLARIAETTGSLNLRETAKTLQVNPKALTTHMLTRGWLFRAAKSDRLVGRQPKLDAKLMEHKAVAIESGRTVSQPFVTPRGLTRLADELSPDLFAASANTRHPARAET